MEWGQRPRCFRSNQTKPETTAAIPNRISGRITIAQKTVMPVPTSISDLNVNDNLNSPQGNEVGSSSNGPDDYFRALSGVLRRGVAKTADIAVSTTLAVPLEGALVTVAGSGTVAALSSRYEGRSLLLDCAGVVTFTHSANLQCPSAVNLVTSAGDVVMAVQVGASSWRLAWLVRNGLTTDFVASGTITALGFIVSGSGLGGIQTNTPDGTDNRGAYLAGGGALSNSRGGYFLAYGNEHPTEPGRVSLVPGTAGRIDLYDSVGSIAWQLQGNGVLRNLTNAQPFWRLGGSGAKSSGSGNLYAGVGLADSHSGGAANWNATTGLLTIPVPGLYLIHLSASASVNNGLPALSVQVNGSFNVAPVQLVSPGSVLISASGMSLIRLNAGDTLQPQWSMAGSATVEGLEFSAALIR